jgi:hypothetical protein
VIINRHNYEEFFLLYVDNELNTEDRAAVEAFLKQNADLAEELEMLMQAILPGDNIQFESKELLYKKEEGISLDNYEEYFLLAVDGELNQRENEEVEKFVLKHPELQNEFTLLFQAKLEPETIKFAGKENLFRKEEKERRVLFPNWMKMSAAAATIGLAVMTWFFTKDDRIHHAAPIVAAKDKTVKPSQELTAPVKSDKTVVDKDIAALPESTLVKPDVERVTPKRNKSAKAVELKASKNLLAVSKKQSESESTTDNGAKPLKVTEEIENRKAFEDAIASAKILNSTSAIKDEPKHPSFVSNTDQNSSLSKQAVYKELDTRENDEENTFYLGSAEINKNKLKGLFKKAAIFFERKNNNNDGEKTLRIAVFEIKSK